MDKHPSIKLKDVVAQFDISTSTMSDIIKKREQIQSACTNPDARADSKRAHAVTHAVTHADTDKALIIWFRQKAVLPDIRIDGSMLLIKVNQFRLDFDLTDTNVITSSRIDRSFKKQTRNCQGPESWRVGWCRHFNCAPMEGRTTV